MTFIIDTAGNFHPYECGGPEEGCPHCQRAVTERHDPARCGLCDPDAINRAAHAADVPAQLALTPDKEAM